jgi:murein DD-endopeptidase MepM/ murein hydrolase activator NlpD
MKIYYYKQPDTFTLFRKKSSPIKLRYIVMILMLLLIVGFVYWNLNQQRLPEKSQFNMMYSKTSPLLPEQNLILPLNEEAQATSLNLQENTLKSAQKSEEGHINPKASIPALPHSTNRDTVKLITIRPRDTLGKILTRLGVNKGEALRIIKSSDSARKLKKLQPGEKLALTINNHLVKSISYTPDPLSTLLITRIVGDKFSSQIKQANLEPHQSFVKFTVYSSINYSAKKAGLDSKRTAQLANIFKSSIDFSKEKHTGDKICVLFQDYYLNGKKVKDGDIIAAEYKAATNTYQAIRFTDPKGNAGYYSPDGASMEKRFLSAPVKFTRISSLFNPKRWHPILHRFRHHNGVDYAAPYGTPVKTVAKGTIKALGLKGGYGNAIMIEHESGYSTLYGHLSKYASGLKVGSHVQQGQLIGYVGSSGLATGPHLHFEFRINGVHHNPLTVALPNGKSITHAYRYKFHSEVKKLLAKMDAHKNKKQL